MKRTVCLWLVAAMLFALSACGGTSDSKQVQESTPPQSSAPAEKSEPTASPDEMDLGDYHVKVLGVITGIKDYEGKDAVGIKYEFTNNGEEAESASTAIYTAAYQNGIEMDYTYLDEENAPEECLNRDKSIKPGVTLVCAEYFSLDGTKADVEFELRAAFSMSNAEIQKTYSIT